MRHNLGAELHILRSCIRAVEDFRAQRDAEHARFGLYSALDAGDTEKARIWLTALDVALRVTPLDKVIRDAADAAITRVSEYLETEED